MIKSKFLVLLLFSTFSLSNGDKKAILGLSTESVNEMKPNIKTTIASLQMSKDDLDIEQIDEQRGKTLSEPSKLIGDEHVPEKVKVEPSPESQAMFKKASEFLEKGKGHGRNGKLAAHQLFESAATLGHVEAKKLAAFNHLFGDYARWSISEAKQTFIELEKDGSPDAQLALGFMHATGVGVEKSDQSKAIIYYMFSALGGNPLAQMAMGFRYAMGVGVPQSCETALSYYQKVAKSVVDNVKFATSQSLQRIRLTDEADPTAVVLPGNSVLDTNLVEYYKMLADKGDLSAQVGLGQMYLTGGRGIPQNFETAYLYLENAASAGSADANSLLGKMYLDGTAYTPRNYEKAFEHLHKAAEKSSPSAQAALGIMYLKGKGVRKDYEKAFKLLSMAADKKHSDGQLYLGELHYKGIPTTAGLKRDFKKAAKMFQMSSQSGHVLAFYNLAQMNAAGTGVPRSCSHAVDLFKSVAERGSWGVKIMEAYSAYKDGRQDEAAMKYLFMAEMGYETAQTNLAYILDRGEASALFAGPRDNVLERALIQWQRSANQEYSLARIKVGDYYYYGMGTEPDFSLAYSHYKTAAERHSLAQAMFNLGYMHEVGEGIARDLHLAKRYYDHSIEQSLDAYMPAKLALAKLMIVDILDQINQHPIISYVEVLVGPKWDMILMTLALGVPVFIFGWRRFVN